MIYEFNNYRSYLKASLDSRTERNPRYSLRAFAKQLGIAGSSLSEVINGKANLSRATSRKIARGLSLDIAEVEYFCLLVELDQARDADERETLLKRLRAVNPGRVPAHDLSVDEFRQISEWYHSAILEMIGLPEFEMSAETVAKVLRITLTEAAGAIERLERLELIERDPQGRFVRTQDRLMVRSATSNAAMRHFYRQMLAKADSALESQTTGERISGYETFAISEEGLPEAREAVDRFLNELAFISGKFPGNRNVYHALVHVFNLTPERKQS